MNHKVSISDLKAKLSAYVSAVRAGGLITILDRNRPVAKLVGLGEQSLRVLSENSKPFKFPKLSGICVKDDPAKALIDDRRRR